MIIPRDKGRWPARARCRQRIDRVLRSERFRTLADLCGMGRLDVATQHASSVAHIVGRPDSLLPEAVDVSIIQSSAAGATGGGGLPVAWLAATRWTSALRNKRLTLRDITRDIRDLGRERDWHTPSSGGLGGRFSPHRATRRRSNRELQLSCFHQNRARSERVHALYTATDLQAEPKVTSCTTTKTMASNWSKCSLRRRFA
jgi:hypothetical protein